METIAISSRGSHGGAIVEEIIDRLALPAFEYVGTLDEEMPEGHHGTDPHDPVLCCAGGPVLCCAGGPVLCCSGGIG